MKFTPKVPRKISIVEEAINSGRYEICPDFNTEYPKIMEPMHNPSRDEEIPRWNPKLFSFELPDGAAFFCDLLQSNDPQEPWEKIQPGDIMENEEIEAIAESIES